MSFLQGIYYRPRRSNARDGCCSKSGLVLRALRLSRQSFVSFFELNADGVERHANQLVLAGGEHQIKKLLIVVAFGQRSPGSVVDERIRVQLVHGLQERGVKLAPARCIRAFWNSADLVGCDPRGLSHGHVVSPFILRAAQPAHAQDRQLALPRRQSRLSEHVIAKYEPPAQELWMPGQRDKDVED